MQQVWNQSIHGELAENVFPSRGRTGSGGDVPCDSLSPEKSSIRAFRFDAAVFVTCF